MAFWWTARAEHLGGELYEEIAPPPPPALLLRCDEVLLPPSHVEQQEARQARDRAERMEFVRRVRKKRYDLAVYEQIQGVMEDLIETSMQKSHDLKDFMALSDLMNDLTASTEKRHKEEEEAAERAARMAEEVKRKIVEEIYEEVQEKARLSAEASLAKEAEDEIRLEVQRYASRFKQAVEDYETRKARRDDIQKGIDKRDDAVRKMERVREVLRHQLGVARDNKPLPYRFDLVQQRNAEIARLDAALDGKSREINTEKCFRKTLENALTEATDRLFSLIVELTEEQASEAKARAWELACAQVKENNQKSHADLSACNASDTLVSLVSLMKSLPPGIR